VQDLQCWIFVLLQSLQNIHSSVYLYIVRFYIVFGRVVRMQSFFVWLLIGEEIEVFFVSVVVDIAIEWLRLVINKSFCTVPPSLKRGEVCLAVPWELQAVEKCSLSSHTSSLFTHSLCHSHFHH
jgi:hypothetical protein